MAYVIAEIGFNHEGDNSEAKEMVRAAAEAGANAVKFQTFRAEDIVLPGHPNFRDLRTNEMSLAQHRELAETAAESGVDFLSTPYSPWAVDLLENVGVPAYKIASMDCTNTYLLRYVAQTRKPIYLATGMATLTEIAATLEYLGEQGSGPVTLLHCLSQYPANAVDLNLEVIPFLKSFFGFPTGYSDHFPGPSACLAAVMLGAEVLETHFTLDPGRKGADHRHSLDPVMLKRLISDIELFKAMRGHARAILTRADRGQAVQYRRGIYTAREMVRGESIHLKDLLHSRPSAELSPGDLEWIEGRSLARDLPAFHPITKEVLREPSVTEMPPLWAE